MVSQSLLPPSVPSAVADEGWEGWHSVPQPPHVVDEEGWEGALAPLAWLPVPAPRRVSCPPEWAQSLGKETGRGTSYIHSTCCKLHGCWPGGTSLTGLLCSWDGHGMARHGTAFHSMVRYGKAWHRMAQHSTALHCMAQHGMAQYCMAQYYIAWYSMAQLHCTHSMPDAAVQRQDPAPRKSCLARSAPWGRCSQGVTVCSGRGHTCTHSSVKALGTG